MGVLSGLAWLSFGETGVGTLPYLLLLLSVTSQEGKTLFAGEPGVSGEYPDGPGGSATVGAAAACVVIADGFAGNIEQDNVTAPMTATILALLFFFMSDGSYSIRYFYAT